MKKTEQIIQLRRRKLGLLLMDARLASNREIEECALWLGISPEQYQEMETGQRSPGLPELEILAHLFHVPISHFWGGKSLSENSIFSTSEKVHEYIKTRNQTIAAILKTRREQNAYTMDEISEKTGLSSEVLEAFENNQHSLPLPEMEVLANVLQQAIDDLLDQETMIGDARLKQIAFEKFSALPDEIREFVSQPVNEPYLRIAKRLSTLSVEELRTIAESLLDITY